MAVLAISALGAGVSSALGFSASAGWLVGSLIGGLLFQKKGPNTQGPRLTDLTVQSATEGAPIPIVYGRMRIAGNMIWTGGIVEVKTKKKQGGKGMGGSSTHTTYTYHASFAIGLCEGPIQGVRKIWADGKLIYANAADSSAATLYGSKKKMANITIYTGSETQTADPIIAAAVGAGNCPAFRGLAYIVFDRLQLADFGNRIPNLTVEVVTGAEGTYLWRVNTWPTTFDTDSTEFINGIIRRVYYTNTTGSFQQRRVRDNDLAGNLLRDTLYRAVEQGSGTAQIARAARHKVRIAQYAKSAQNNPEAYQWMVDDTVVENWVTMGTFGDTNTPYDPNRPPVYHGGYIFVTPSNLDASQIDRRAANGVARFVVNPSLTTAGQPDKFVNLAEMGLCTPRGNTSYVVRRISVTDEGTLLFNIHTDNIITFHIVEFDINLNFIKGYTVQNYSDVAWLIRNGRFLVTGSGSTDGYNDLRLLEEQSPGVYTQVAFRSNFIGGSPPDVLLHSLGNGLFLSRNGVWSIYPPITPGALTVGDIVADISNRCGLSSGLFDTTPLNQSIDGYVISQPMTGRSAIEPLMQAFFFDGVESDFVVKFIKRPGTIVATIEEGDLGAGIDRAAPEDIKRRRMQELELPVEIRISYLDIGNDFQPGLQSARRLITDSRHTVDIQFAIAMSSAKAAQIADITLRNLWAERDTYEFHLTREFVQLDPADLVNLPDGNVLRLASVEYTDPGLVKVAGLRDVSNAYTSIAVGNSTSHEYPQEVAIVGPTQLEFLDIAPLREEDSIAGFYIAAYGPLAGWRGAEIVRSDDNGATYGEFDIITTESTIGYATTSLAAPQVWGMFDLSTGVTISISTPGATLSSISDDALLAGGNPALIGNEIIQFGEATLVSPGVYRLSRLLRGLLGSEAHMTSHAIGDRFVLLDSNIRFMADGLANINVSKIYKAITFGLALDEVDTEAFTHTGKSLMNPAPLNTGASMNTIGGWVFTWVRRNRTSWWFSAGAMPLVDNEEQYRIRIYDTLGNLKNTYTTTSQTFTYTRAQQIADFGYPIFSFEARIAQISDNSIIGHELSVTPTPPARGRYLSMHRLFNPVMYWRNLFDATPDDDSGNNYDGTTSGTVSFNSTDIPIVGEPTVTAFKSASTTAGYFQRVNTAALNITWPMSLSIWVKFTVTDTARTIAGIWDSATQANRAYQIAIGTATGSLRFRVELGGVIRTAQHSGGYNDGNWHHVVGVYEPDGSVRLYVDGVLRATGTGAYLPILSTPSVFRVGQNANGTEQYVGQFAEVAVHERALSAAAVANLYNCARGLV